MFTNYTSPSLRAIDIYLVRHGATWNNTGVPEKNIPPNACIQGGCADEELHKLSLAGKKEAKDLGCFLKKQFPHLPLIYTARLKRTVETAKIAAVELGFMIKGLSDTDEDLALKEENISIKEDLAEIKHGRNDGKTTAACRNALYKKMLDKERENHPLDATDFDPYWKWKLVPKEEGAAGSFDDAENSFQLLTRVINTLSEIGTQHLENKDLGCNVIAITSSAVILSLKTNSAWRKHLKDCAIKKISPTPQELPLFFEQSLAKTGGIYHFRFHPEEQEFLDKIEYIQEIQ